MKRNIQTIPWFIVAATLTLALAFETVSLLASHLWLSPDSTAYIKLGAGIADRYDFAQQLFQFRRPGYPLFLAAIFAMFGPTSPTAILIIQHLMVATCSVITVALAWTLAPSRLFVCVVGLLSALSLHLSGYANAVMTEVPYTLMSLTSVWMLIRYYIRGGSTWLIGASLAAAAAYLTKDIGQLLIVLCPTVALLRSALTGSVPRPAPANVRRPLRDITRRWFAPVALSIVPACGLILPVMWNNHRAHGHFQVNCTGAMYRYTRAACLDKLDSTTSPAVAKIRAAVDRAREQGWIPAGATHHDYLPTLTACARMYDPNAAAFDSTSLTRVSQLLGEAGTDLMLEHRWSILKTTATYSYRLLMMPDEGYRMQPNAPFEKDRRRPGRALFAAHTYAQTVTDRVGENIMTRYLPGDATSTPTQPFWSRLTRWYYERIECGTPIIGILDTPYEEFIGLSILGTLLSLCVPWRPGRRRSINPSGATLPASLLHRIPWLILMFVIACTVVGSAFFGGVEPRYIIPLHPLMNLFAAIPLAQAVLIMHRIAIGASGRRKATPLPAILARPT